MEEMGRLDRSVSWSKCPLWFGIIVNPKRARADKHEQTRTEQIHLPVLPTRFGSCFIKTFLDFHVRPQTKEKQQLQRPQKKLYTFSSTLPSSDPTIVFGPSSEMGENQAMFPSGTLCRFCGALLPWLPLS